MTDTHIRVRRDPMYGSGFTVHVVRPCDESVEVLTGDGWMSIDPNEAPGPTTTLEPDSARELLDELWAAGLRQTGWAHAGQVEALQLHLQDERRYHQLLLDNLLEGKS